MMRAQAEQFDWVRWQNVKQLTGEEEFVEFLLARAFDTFETPRNALDWWG
jgi:hypothetical protein